MTEPTEVTLSWYDYTVLLGYAFHHAGDQEMCDSLSGIMERTRKRMDAARPENRSVLGGCTASRDRGGLLCTEPAGHGPLTDSTTAVWQHHDGGRNVWWDQVTPDEGDFPPARRLAPCNLMSGDMISKTCACGHIGQTHGRAEGKGIICMVCPPT